MPVDMRVLSDTERREVLRLLWPQHVDSAEPHADTLRWHQQGFALQALDANFPLGLVQGHGGPCGVLAAVQAEILRLFLFEYHKVQRRVADSSGRDGGDATPDSLVTLQELLASVAQAGESGQRALLTEALASVLMRCSIHRDLNVASAQQRSVHIVVLDPATTTDAAAEPVYHEYVTCATDHRDPELLRIMHEHLGAFESPHGVMNFVFSVVRTKSVEAIRTEMDDADAAFTAQFGHCSQELLNLLLTGSAVSNVFDGSVPMGDSGLMLHGVPARAPVGYLTQLEALRYCEVGSYYKSPEHPVWVIGSTSHFSVCFALDPCMSEASSAQMLLERVQRVFKAFDPMETGFMDIGVLAESLTQLGVARDVLANEYWMARLLAQLEVAGAGIVLWDEYWKVISVLLHTGDLELALSGDYQRRVREQEGSQQQRPRSDSDLARELQAQFDAESGGGSGSTPAATTDTRSTQSSSSPPSAGAAAADESFDLFYYNGLGSSDAGGRRPQLAKCRVTVPKRVDFVGASVPIFETGTGGGYGSAPLDEIIKTKWRSARIDWQGQSVPSID